MKFQTRSHSVFNLKIHLILVVAYQRKVINTSIMNTLRQTITEVCDSFTIRIIEFSGEMDHVHLLLEIVPTIRISDLVRTIKSVTSCRIRASHWNECYDTATLSHIKLSDSVTHNSTNLTHSNNTILSSQEN